LFKPSCAVAAVTGPAVASLIGDFFPAGDRGRMYGLIIGGELAGTGLGFVVAGDISSVLSWRAAFWWLALPSLALAWAVWRLTEPGLRAFAILFTTGHYGLSKAVASPLVLVVGIGALAGVYAGGRTADRLLVKGYVRARILVPTVCLLAITPLFGAAIVTTSIMAALPLLALGAALLGAANPPMDAARLDIMHPGCGDAPRPSAHSSAH
jgi:predicted MFS family arabinose efflux permease